jgi:hypothetical protein
MVVLSPSLWVALKDGTTQKMTTLQYKFFLNDGPAIIIRSVKDILLVELPDMGGEDFGLSLGLMGTYETAGEQLGRDGVTVIEDTNMFGQEWQVQDKDPQLFHEVEGPQFPQKCIMPLSQTDAAIASHRLGASFSRKDAENACWHVEKSDFKNCVFDVMAMDDLSAAEGY